METIDKSKFRFVERDSRASEVIDTPAYSYWKSVFRQFFSKKSTIFLHANDFSDHLIDEFYLPNVCEL